MDANFSEINFEIERLNKSILEKNSVINEMKAKIYYLEKQNADFIESTKYNVMKSQYEQIKEYQSAVRVLAKMIGGD